MVCEGVRGADLTHISASLFQVDGDIPTRVKRDAHELILDFIRSRPPLKPVGMDPHTHAHLSSCILKYNE